MIGETANGTRGVITDDRILPVLREPATVLATKGPMMSLAHPCRDEAEREIRRDLCEEFRGDYVRSTFNVESDSVDPG